MFFLPLRFASIQFERGILIQQIMQTKTLKIAFYRNNERKVDKARDDLPCPALFQFPKMSGGLGSETGRRKDRQRTEIVLVGFAQVVVAQIENARHIPTVIAVHLQFFKTLFGLFVIFCNWACKILVLANSFRSDLQRQRVMFASFCEFVNRCFFDLYGIFAQ